MTGDLFEGRADKVVEGRNGRLFIADFGAPDHDEMLVDKPLPDWRLKLWRLSLERHARFLAERAVPLVILVAPEAVTAWPDDLPEGWPRPGQQVGRVFAEAMAGIPNLRVVYPLEPIWQAEGGLATYKKHDSHWSAYGAFIAYRELLAALPPDLPVRRIGAADVAYVLRDGYGNLGAHADFDRKMPVAHPRVDGPPPEIVRRTVGVLRRSFEVARAPGASARALIFRDSFASEMRPYLFATFGETWFLGPTQEIDENLVEEVRPDVVIVQTSERRLLRVAPDHALFGWRELFDIDMASPAGKACARLAQAHDVEGPEAVAKLAEEVAAGDGLQPQHLIHCAYALHRAGRFEEAKAYAGRAVRQDAAFASGWRLIALAEAASPDADEAAWTDAARQMLRAGPRNPRHHQEYALGLIQFGRLQETQACLREAVEALPESVGLRLLLGRVLRRSGDRPGAVVALAPALELLDPRSGQYEAVARFVAGGPWKVRP